MSLASRIGRVERLVGTDGAQRRVIVFFSSDYEESWVERVRAGLHFHVRTPGHDAAPLEHLTAEMRAMLRPSDAVTLFAAAGCDRRNPHLQKRVPPAKRRPYRRPKDGKSYELMDEEGRWHRHEFDR